MSNSQADLAEQDTQLFQQFFALEDSIEELKTQMQSEDFYDYYDSDDDLSSITSSACSIASVHEVVKPATADGDEEDDVFEAWTPKVGHVIQYKINLYTRLQKKAAFVLFWRHCGRASPAFLTQVCARMWHALDAKRFEPEKIKFMLNPGKKYLYAKKNLGFACDFYIIAVFMLQINHIFCSQGLFSFISPTRNWPPAVEFCRKM
jgi:hypothetical protein